MTIGMHHLAQLVRTLILEIDKLGYVFNEISEKYLDGYAEDEDTHHPIRKLSVSVNNIWNTNNDIVKKLLEENILDPDFRKSLQELAFMDRLRDGKYKSEFVKLVEKYIKD